MGAFEISHIDEFIDLLLNEVLYPDFVFIFLQDFYRIVYVKLFYLDCRKDPFWKKTVNSNQDGVHLKKI